RLDTDDIRSLTIQLQACKSSSAAISMTDHFPDTKGQWFYGWSLHKLFKANTDMPELTLRTSPEGLSNIHGKSDEFDVQYYVVKLGNPNEDEDNGANDETPPSTQPTDDEDKILLNQHADELNQLQEQIQLNGALSVKHGKLTLELALKAGTILNEAKQLVRRGYWEKWIEDNVKSISIRTAENYMRFATETATKHISLSECEGLREAYLLTGIIKKPKTIKGPVAVVDA